MRMLGLVVASSLVAASAQADPQVTYVDDEPMSQHVTTTAARPAAPAIVAIVDRRLPADVGELRSAAVSAPAPSRVDTGAAVTREHDVAPPHAVGAIATSAELAVELAARQMRRHQHALDGCVAAAQRRRPAITGTVTLTFDVADRKVADVHIAGDSAHDFALAACLTNMARAFTFSLAAAHFDWAVNVTPTASR
jgi:hypothetical protein